MIAEQSPSVPKAIVEKLASEINSFQKEMIHRMPDNVRKDILAASDPINIYNLSEDSQKWVGQNIANGVSEGISKYFDLLSVELRLSGDRLGDEDYSAILEQSFFHQVRTSPFNLEEEILHYANYWREHTTPNVRLSPNGLGEIDWRWQLSVAERPDGVLHVGIDRKKRTFICYERTVGIYFPEGDVMERIYAEIVQDPNMAGEFVGKGRLKSQ